MREGKTNWVGNLVFMTENHPTRSISRGSPMWHAKDARVLLMMHVSTAGRSIAVKLGWEALFDDD